MEIARLCSLEEVRHDPFLADGVPAAPDPRLAANLGDDGVHGVGTDPVDVEVTRLGDCLARHPAVTARHEQFEDAELGGAEIDLAIPGPRLAEGGRQAKVARGDPFAPLGGRGGRRRVGGPRRLRGRRGGSRAG